jgi:hypothetical protein
MASGYGPSAADEIEQLVTADERYVRQMTGLTAISYRERISPVPLAVGTHSGTLRRSLAARVSVDAQHYPNAMDFSMISVRDVVPGGA